MTGQTTRLLEATHVARLQRIERTLAEGKHNEVAAELNKVVKERPADPRVYLLGAKLAEATGHKDGMLKAAARAYELAPHWLVAAAHLASVYSVLGMHEDALRQCEIVYQLAPTQADVLQRLVSIAHAARAYPKVHTWLLELQKLQPDNDNVSLALARNHAIMGRHAEGIALLNALVEKTPDNMPLRVERARELILSGQPELAREDATILIASSPEDETYQFIASLAHGQTPARQPAAMVESTFDSYASDFDQHLVRQLRYRLPKDVADQVFTWYPDRTFNLLDLGCGTGLLGVCLGRINGALIGVDLSEAMLNKAAEHGVYHRLHHVDLLDAVKATPDSLYHVIAALDVLIYVGDLATVVHNAHRILLPKGRFVFSSEAMQDMAEDYVLDPKTLRYKHSAAYLRRLLEQAGFDHIEFSERTIRYQSGQPVQGYLITAVKP